MNNLEESGKIVRNKYNHYYLPNQFGMVLGTLTINKRALVCSGRWTGKRYLYFA